VIPVWPFVAVTLPLVLSPGVSTAVVLRNSVSGGVKAGLQTAAGANAGSVCYGLLSAAGMSLALQRWPSAWLVLRAGGTAYIAWLGLQSLRRVFVPARARTHEAVTTTNDPRGFVHVYQGFVTNVLNPAIATFYLVIVPGFVPQGAPVARSILILTIIHVVMAASWHITWATAGGALAHLWARRRPRQVLDLVAGLTLVALAIKLARA
jgi:threonine/homoserine/homoserine lactone efflux protein